MAHPGGHFLLGKGQRTQGTVEEDADSQVRVQIEPRVQLSVPSQARGDPAAHSSSLGRAVFPPPFPAHPSHILTPSFLTVTLQGLNLGNQL